MKDPEERDDQKEKKTQFALGGVLFVQYDCNGDQRHGECQSSESHYATPEALSLMPRGLFNLMHSVLRAAVGVLDIALDESYGFGLLAHKTLNVSETLVDLVDVRRNAFCCLLTVAHLLR